MKKNIAYSEVLQKKIDDYFSSLEPRYQYDEGGEIIIDKSGIPILTERRPATVSSLAYAMGCSSRAELEEKKNGKYKNIIQRALLRLEAYTEEMLFDKSASSGAKFLLQTDFGRTECKESESNPGGVVILSEIEKTEED